jgi:hypothetical protein
MSFAIPLFVSLLLAQPVVAPSADRLNSTLGAQARVTRDAAGGHVRQLASVQIPLADVTLGGVIAGFFAPLRADLGVDPAELVEVKRESWADGTSVTLQRVIDGREVIDGVFRVTLGRDGAVRSYAAGDVAPVTRPTTPLIDVAEAVVAAQKVLPGLAEPGASDLAYLGGKLAWRLRFAPAPARQGGALSLTYAPVVFVDAANGEVLALRNGLVR